MAELRKIIIVLVIALLFTVFVFSFNEAVNERPKYEDYCVIDAMPVKPYVDDANCTEVTPSDAEIEACKAQHGTIQYSYDGRCIHDYKCETCQYYYDLAQSRFKFWQFLLAAVFGLVAVVIGLFLPGKNPLNEWIGSGFLFGGLITLFIGTALYFSDFYKWLRPIVILLELLLVIFVAYKRLKKK